MVKLGMVRGWAGARLATKGEWCQWWWIITADDIFFPKRNSLADHCFCAAKFAHLLHRAEDFTLACIFIGLKTSH
jgi:hypothetical protein